MERVPSPDALIRIETILEAASAQMPEKGALMIVSTPIGNLADITLRAIQVLREADLILCEDTRHSRHLLDAFGVTVAVRSLHEHNESESIAYVLSRLAEGARLALISDAGTPLLSDPGAVVVRAVLQAGYPVVPVPGASALLAATVASGVSGAFQFLGFLPRKGKDRQRALSAISATAHVSVVYEAANRLTNTLDELSLAWGDASSRGIAVCRELTKRFEEVRRGTVVELIEYYRTQDPRGEVVLVIEGREEEGVCVDEALLREVVAKGRQGGLDSRAVMQELMENHGAPRNLAYRLAHTD